MTSALVWFYNDLRLGDNPALVKAIESGKSVIPLFIWDENNTDIHTGSAAKWWLHQSLDRLSNRIEEIGSKLILRSGDPKLIINELVEKHNISSIYLNRRFEPPIIKRDEDILSKIDHTITNGNLLFTPEDIRTMQDKQYTVFTPFWKNCKTKEEPHEPFPAPTTIPAPEEFPESLTLDEMELLPKIKWYTTFEKKWRPGEEEAKKSAEDAEAEKDEEAAAEEEPVTEVIKSMIREMMAERKWGQAEKAKATPEQKLQAAGITADELRSMVLQTVMHGEEERDMEMIKLLKDMLGSLQSIEYHSTPAKGAGSQLAQTAAKGWVNEGKNNKIFTNIPSLISEMRDAGLEQEADDHESFFKWALAGSDLTMQEIKNEADAQIADLKAMLRKMSNHVTGDEESLEKQKLRGEVPGHH